MHFLDIIAICPEASGLPEQFISNIYKVANEQNKLNDKVWLKKVVINAKKKYEDQQKIKIEKKNSSLVKKENSQNEKEKLDERNKLFLKALEELPVIKNYTKLFPNVSFPALVYIQKKHGFWTLRMLSVLDDKRKIYTNFAIKFTSLLRSDIFLQECVKLGLHKNSELLYKTVVQHPKYNEKKYEIDRFFKWKENEFVEKKGGLILYDINKEIKEVTCTQT